MAKTAKLKKKQAAPHSRAARRAASPSLPISLPAARRSTSPTTTTTPHHKLTQSAGVSKKRNTKMSRAQRVRAEKAMERAADDMDKWELKKKKSIEKAGVIKGRAKLWEEVNGESIKGKKGGDSAFSVLEEGRGVDSEGRKGRFGDEEMGGADEVEREEAKVEESQATNVAPPGDDELL